MAFYGCIPYRYGHLDRPRTKLMTQKNHNGRQQRWRTHISRFACKLEYQPGAKNFLADYLSTIHEGTPGLFDISRKDPTIVYDSHSYLTLPNPYTSLQATPPLPTLALNQAMGCTTQAKPNPLPPVPAVTLSVVAALNTFWTKLLAMK